MADGSVLAKNRSNVLRSKEALLLNSLLTKMGGRDEMIKASINLKGIKEKDIPKGEVFKRHGVSWLRLEQVE